jgi:hypothetical protein
LTTARPEQFSNAGELLVAKRWCLINNSLDVVFEPLGAKALA